ncbi:MAG: hypothetical protein APR63_13945 [Desulfuromonas sp. SDB]|nr:MAG: hypothetical protein APR63_13945 [Desulfuromonas sp. SDB]
MTVKLRKKKIKNGGFSYYLDIYYSKKNRKYETLGIHVYKNDSAETKKRKKNIAEKYRAKRELELFDDIHGNRTRVYLNADFIKYYKKIADRKGKKNRYYISAFEKFADFTKGKIVKFSDLNESLVNGFKDYLLDNLSNNSAQIYFVTFKSIIRNAYKDRIIPFDLIQNIPGIRIHEIEREYLTEEELRQLAKTEWKDNQTRNAFLFACYTGMRISDLRKLTWDDIENNQIKFQQQKTKGFEYIPINDPVKHILENIRNDHDKPKGINNNLVFRLKSTNGYNNNLKKWAKKAGINKNLTSHVARHTFATLSLTYGVDIYTVQKLMGHKDIKTTQIYAKIIDPKKDEAIASLPNIFEDK